MFRVLYDVKYTDKSLPDYGCLVECERQFESFMEAVEFVRKIKRGEKTLIGHPVLEEMLVDEKIVVDTTYSTV